MAKNKRTLRPATRLAVVPQNGDRIKVSPEDMAVLHAAQIAVDEATRLLGEEELRHLARKTEIMNLIEGRASHASALNETIVRRYLSDRPGKYAFNARSGEFIAEES